MHKYEIYGSWENCSNYWNSATEKSIKENPNPPESSNEITILENENKNKIKIYILNKKYLSKKLIINNFNKNDNKYGKYNDR